MDIRCYPRAVLRVWIDQKEDEEREANDHAASVRDPTVTCPTIQSDVAVPYVSHIILQTHCGYESALQASYSCIVFNTDTSATPSTMLSSQSDVKFYRMAKRGV